ncbi:Vps51/Vps67 family protein [Candida parapsilosis]|uniref:Vps51/Vps67 family protein n=1 Tax=Candida parapsilosis TaxID=5480 RepID=A0A8X7TDS6_CANPA|nr:Vps51/Vps67 family protein [Candida parapsilosis]
MADVSNGTGTNDQFQIQRLSSQYSTIIATTKNELHNLVSDKYRDLIKIAEDIGDLRNNSLTIEEKLQEISYKPSTFVSPYKDSYANLNPLYEIRMQPKLNKTREHKGLFNGIANAKFVDDISFIEEDFDEFQDDDDAEEDGTDDIQVKQERFDKLDTFKNTNYNRNVSALVQLLNNRDSDYFRTLRDIAKPWSLVELVGHRGWIDDSQVDFGEFLDTDGEYLEVNPNSSNKIVEFISRLASISSQSTETPPTMDFLTSSIVKYYTFIMSLKRLDDATKLVGVQSQLIDLVSKTKLLDELSANLESLIKESTITIVTHNPFDVDVVNVMDYNLGEYMKLVINKGDNTNKAPYNTTYQLKQWLNESFQLKKITDFNRDFSEMLRGKKDIYDYLPQLYHSLRSDGVQWGDFTGDSLKKRFQTLSTSVNQSFNQEISKFSTSLFELSSEEREVSKLIYLIGLLTSLRNEIKSKIAATNSDTGALMTAVDSNIDSIFKKVVSHVLDGEVYNLRQLIIAKESQANEVDIPTRPNIQLASKMYEVAQAFLTQASKIEPHNVDLFSNSSLVPSQFIKVKNEWFEKSIEVIVFQINSSMNESDKADVKEEEAGATTCDTGTESKASKDANSNDNAVDEAKQNEASDFNRDANESQTYILQTAANIAFLNGISSFYKTRKNVYLPLS